MNLYALRNEVTRTLARKDGHVLYFSSKRRAKAIRNHWTHATGQKHVVVLGPDHKRSNEEKRPHE